MMKIIVRIMYGILVLLTGFVVFSDASFQRTQNFYFDSATKNLENNLPEFVHDTMLITGSNRFLKEPIYRLRSEDNEFSFNLTIYHFQQIKNENISSGIMFYVSNLETNEEIDGISFRFKSEVSNLFVDTNITTKINEENVKGNVIDPILFSFDEDTGFIFNDSNNKKITLPEIKEIELRTLTIEDGDINIDKDVFAIIKHSNHHDIESSNEFQFVRKGNILEINSFTGNILDYQSLDEKYELSSGENNVYTTTNLEKIQPYNYLVTRTMSIYIGVVLVSTYLLFFLKPTIDRFKEIKAQKKQKDNKENDAKSID